ncbi:MAG: hypothetical protein HUJ29_05210 [Gammaproteobacteria bacterium]|nr:hypothetical protein [Gammaproteobacteria bacterium]
MIRVLPMLLVGLMFNLNAAAFEKIQKGAKPVDHGQAYEWQEDGQRRVVYMSKSLVAEFPGTAMPMGVVQKAFPRAEESQARGTGVRIWSVTTDDVTRAITAIRNLDAGTKVSPVFYDAKNGTRRALPGGVILRFEPTWDEQRARAWIKSQDYEIEQVIGDEKKFYLVRTGSGLDALETAKLISQANVAESVTPNWWVERLPR